MTDPDGKFIALSPSELKNQWKNGGQMKNITFRDYMKYALVHEIGHIMDVRHGNKYSQGLYSNEVNGKVNIICIFELCWQGDKHEQSPSSYGESSDAEDWAETVATEVYPGVKPENDHGDWRPAPKHRDFVDRVLSGKYK